MHWIDTIVVECIYYFSHPMLSLHSLRKRTWATQETIAELIGTTRQTYSRMEKWAIDINIGQAVKLAEYYDISVSDLLPTDMETTSPTDKPLDWSKYVQIIKNFIKYWSDRDGKITKTKLAKLCYLLDFSWYYTNLQSLTWLDYRRLAQWPVADAYFSAIETLEAEESIEVECKWRAYMISNIEAANDDLLGEEEKSLLQQIAKKWKSANTETIVNFTHQQMPWMMCEDKEIIPYVFITQEDPDHVF